MIKTVANHLPLAVCVRLTARLTLQSLQVTVLAVGVALITHSVSSITRPLSIALTLLHALLLLTDKSLLQTADSYEEITALQTAALEH